jgi:hypothetical protein
MPILWQGKFHLGGKDKVALPDGKGEMKVIIPVALGNPTSIRPSIQGRLS